MLIPTRGWSEADRQDGPLYDPEINRLFTQRLEHLLNQKIEIQEVDHHINDAAFGEFAAKMMDEMVQRVSVGDIP